MAIPLTVLVATINGEDKLARTLPALRAIADELVVGIDDATTDGSAALARQYADVVFDLPHDCFIADGSDAHVGPLELSLPHCHGEWILRVDHDETLSDGWSDRDRVNALLADRRVTHYHVVRRWALAPGDCFISSARWYPDYSVRLFRNLPSIVRGPRSVHADVQVLGEARYLMTEWLIHWDLVWHSREAREAKVRLCDSLGPSSGSEKYVFEDQQFDTRPLDYSPPEVAPSAAGLPMSDDPLGCWIEALEPPTTMVSGSDQFVLISIRNLSPRVFSPGARGFGNGNVKVSHHWLDAAGGQIEPWEQVRVEVPMRLEPGQAAAMYLPVLAVPAPGTYWLQLDLVEEGVAWASYKRRLPAYPVQVVAAS